MTEETVHSKVVGKKEGMYTVYVFQLDDGTLRMCTKLPNWGNYPLKKGDKGFVTLQYFNAGENFYNRDTDSNEIVKFTNVYFKEFIPDSPKTTQVIL